MGRCVDSRGRIELERVSDVVACAIIPCVLPVRSRIREDTPPLPLWERSDRIARCDPGEGLRTIEGPGPLTPTLSHRGRGRSPRLEPDRAMCWLAVSAIQ